MKINVQANPCFKEVDRSKKRYIVLSVVDNVQNEMEKIESEQEKAKTDPVMTQMFGGAGDGKPGVLEEPGNGSKET